MNRGREQLKRATDKWTSGGEELIGEVSGDDDIYTPSSPSPTTAKPLVQMTTGDRLANVAAPPKRVKTILRIRQPQQQQQQPPWNKEEEAPAAAAVAAGDETRQPQKREQKYNQRPVGDRVGTAEAYRQQQKCERAEGAQAKRSNPDPLKSLWSKEDDAPEEKEEGGDDDNALPELTILGPEDKTTAEIDLNTLISELALARARLAQLRINKSAPQKQTPNPIPKNKAAGDAAAAKPAPASPSPPPAARGWWIWTPLMALYSFIITQLGFATPDHEYSGAPWWLPHAFLSKVGQRMLAFQGACMTIALACGSYLYLRRAALEFSFATRECIEFMSARKVEIFEDLFFWMCESSLSILGFVCCCIVASLLFICLFLMTMDRLCRLTGSVPYQMTPKQRHAELKKLAALKTNYLRTKRQLEEATDEKL